MTACVMASLRLACKAKGYEFITAHQILSDDRTKHKHLYLPVSGHELKPDDLGGVRGPSLRFFNLESGRGGEQHGETATSRERKKKTYEGMIKKEAEVLDGRTYQEKWGLPNLHFLHAETTEEDVDLVRSLVAQHVPPGLQKRFHYYLCKEFQSPWHMPPIYEDALDALM